MKRIVIAVSVIILAYLFWCYAHTESYCFFFPSVDTHYAGGFSERAFGEIRVGMTKAEVLQKLGNPLVVQVSSRGELWSYTRDGKCTWGDWAWLCRQVRFNDDKVTEIVKAVLHN